MPWEVRRLKPLEEENRHLKQMVADLSITKNWQRTSPALGHCPRASPG
jgi:hypothetical protein